VIATVEPVHLLVARAEGVSLRRALIDAGSIRFKPIFLTAAAAMIGAAPGVARLIIWRFAARIG
jgi:multidrug efflux pump subunit AcrB